MCSALWVRLNTNQLSQLLFWKLDHFLSPSTLVPIIFLNDHLMKVSLKPECYWTSASTSERWAPRRDCLNFKKYSRFLSAEKSFFPFFNQLFYSLRFHPCFSMQPSCSVLINAELGAAAPGLSKQVRLELVWYLTCGPEAWEDHDDGFLFPGGDLQTLLVAWAAERHFIWTRLYPKSLGKKMYLTTIRLQFFNI